MNLNAPIKREKWFYVCHPILWPTGVRGTWGIFDDNKHHIENRPPGIYFVLGKQMLTAEYLCAKIWWVLGPILRYISLTYLEIELTCKKLGKNFKNWARFQDLKILRNWDFASPWHTEIAITHSIFEIESSSFGFNL